MRHTGRIGNTDSEGDTVKVEATLWINGDGFPQATLHLPSGDVILQIPSKDPKGKVRASKPYRAVMEALGAKESEWTRSRLRHRAEWCERWWAGDWASSSASRILGDELIRAIDAARVDALIDSQEDLGSFRRPTLVNRLSNTGITVFEIDLYDLSIELLKERGVWDRLLAAEPEQDKADFREIVQGMLDPQLHIAPAIRGRLAQADYDIFFLTGIGEVFPYIRSHNVLNNLQSVVKGKPMLMFFPGRYKQSDTLGSSLVLFGRLKDDQYYRAKNILEQEAWARWSSARSSPRISSARSKPS
jgi:hypothetical protein